MTFFVPLKEKVEKHFNAFILTLNPNDTVFYAIALAGEYESENWLNVAREYSDKWHHQMQ